MHLYNLIDHLIYFTDFHSLKSGTVNYIYQRLDLHQIKYFS